MRSLFQRALARVSGVQKPTLITGLFFFLIFLGLLLGDGKQGLVEVYGAALALVLWVFRAVYYKHQSSPLPKQVFYSWMCVFVAVAISTITSISVGFSFSWIVRLLSGYVIYRLFFDLAPVIRPRIFSLGLLVLVGAAGVLSLVFYLFPDVRGITPSMNLLSTSFGHSHLADLFVFIFPLVLAEVLSAKTWRGSGALTLYLVALFSTMARAAWAIILFYALIVLCLVHKTALFKKTLTAVLLITVVVGSLYVGYVWQVTSRSKALTIEFYTRPRSIDVRTRYWQQALEGFINSPVLGSGPGTFSLVSLRYQRAPLSSSWFAHSQPLQVLAEMGVVGLIAFGFLIFSHVRFWYTHRNFLKNNPTHRLLLWGLTLIFIYSCFEFVLDYFIVWLLFWAATGFTAGSVKEAAVKQHDISVKLAVALVGAFYFFWVAGSSSGLFMKRHDVAFLLAPFDATQALVYMSDIVQNKHPFGERLIEVFHKKNPQLLYEISQQKKKEGNQAAYGYYSKEAVFADPQNMEYVSHYLTYLSSLGVVQSGEEVLLLLNHALPKQLNNRVRALSPRTLEIGEAVEYYYSDERPRLKEKYLSLLYVIGLYQWQNNPRLATSLWTLAKDISPDLGAIHIELARLYLHRMHDESKAQKVLQDCIVYESAKDLCAEFMGKELLPPGDFYDVLH